MLTPEVVVTFLQNKVAHTIIAKSMLYFAVTCFLATCVSYIFEKIGKKFKSSNDDENVNFNFYLAFKNPLIMFIWIICAYDIVEIAGLENVIFLQNLEIALMLLDIAWLIFGLTSACIGKIIDSKNKRNEIVDYGGIFFVEKLIQMATFFAVALISMRILGVSLQSLLTIGGIGGLTLGLAAKDTLANIFSTILLYIDKPFTVGDWIASPDKKIEGIVQQIDWRRTVIQSLSKFPIYVSNSVFSNIVLENKSRMICRQIDEMIPVRFLDADKIEKISKEIKETLLNDSNISRKGPTVVYFESVAKPASLNLRMVTFTVATDFLTYTSVKQIVLVKAIGVLKKNGVEIAPDVTRVIFDESSSPEKYFS
jgi:MscS family membrane protein